MEYWYKTQACELFIGSETEHPQLQALALPAGEYAGIAVRPKLGFLWGPAIGQAKGFFYGQWMPSSGYEPANLEYEYHTEKSIGKKPEIDLLFAVRKKG